MADKKKKMKKPKRSGASFSAGPGGIGGQAGRFSGSARFGGGVGMAGPGREVPPGGTPSAKKTTPLGKIPTPRLNPKRGNR